MRVVWVALVAVCIACNGARPPDASSSPTPPASDQASPPSGGCQRDEDCACGTDRKTGACARGLAKDIDPTRQCPDFCSGITGTLSTVCEGGRCVSRLSAPRDE